MVLFALSSAVSAAPPGKFTFVDLQPHANLKRSDNFGSGRDGNHLNDVGKKGPRTLEGVNFQLGDAVIELGSKLLPRERPLKVEGIKVGQKCVTVHILHATEYGNGSGGDNGGKEGDPLWIADGTPIAEYKIHYEDGKTETIPVVYGQHVRDWWFSEKSKDVARGKVAWTGDNDLAKEFGHRIRLYLTTWQNPHPEKAIARIDYLKVGDSNAAPFCVAITLEGK
jgi:hypothetical protein